MIDELQIKSYDLEKAAELLDIDTATMRRLCKQGEIPYFRIEDTLIRIRHLDLVAYVERQLKTGQKAGHAPEYLRAAFLDFLGHYWAAPYDLPETFEIDGMEWQLNRLLSRLAECTDTLSDKYCDILGIPHGSTYGDAIHRVNEKLAGNAAVEASI